jgi:hypothetical protein
MGPQAPAGPGQRPGLITVNSGRRSRPGWGSTDAPAVAWSNRRC